MFFQLMYIHLFRPFLQYTKETSPLPESVSPRKLCTAAASMISKLMRLYKRSHGLRQICNICVYIVHSACTIHLLNLPEKGARRDIVHGVKHLEEIAEGWLCARRSLGMVSVLARKWKVELPDEAATVLARTDRKFGPYTGDTPSPGTVQQHLEAVNSAQYGGQQPFTAISNGPAGTKFSANVSTAGAPQQSFPTQPPSENFPSQQTYGQRIPSLSQQQQAQHQAPTYPPANPSTLHVVSSPSEIFPGNIDQLQSSNDWAYRDQAQLATGFENWMGMDVSPAIWQEGFTQSSIGGGVPVTTGGTECDFVPPQQQQQQNGGAPVNEVADGNGFPSFGLVGPGFAEAGRGYNEEEWYQ